MCGIVGAFDTLGRRPPDRGRLSRMNAVQVHRGPDADAELVGDGAALAYRRLAIIDVAGGRQPLLNEDGSVAVIYNGEIYNHQELRRDLVAAGHRFRTRCDTEAIVHGWEEWGPACVDRFNGMFAFALWDRNRDTLFLARDRLGKKPLHYALLPDGWLYFASEIKSLLEVDGLDRSIDPEAVEAYFAYGYVPDPRTIFKSVRKLPPAHTLVIQRGGPVRPRPYWDLAFAEPVMRSEAEVAEELRARLREAVRIRLMSEVPLGAFLSGGLDSSAVVAMMAGLSAVPVKTCSISFADRSYDEAPYAALMARRFGTDHLDERVAPDGLGLVDRLARVYDEPFADSSAIPTYRVSEVARRRVTVALSGDGGDETFLGYRRYRWHQYEERVRNLVPSGVRGAVFGPLARTYPKLDWAPRYLRAKTTLESLARPPLEGYFHAVSMVPDRVRLPLYSPEFRRELAGYHAIEVLRGHAANAGPRDSLSFAQYLDFKTYLPGDILVKADRASMAHSLEMRMPLLDHTLVDWVARLPSDLKLRRGRSKYIFKSSLHGVLPAEILERPKMGFSVPLADWLRGPLAERVRSSVLGPRLAGTGWFEPRALRRLVDQHRSGRRDHSAALWALLVFDAFLGRVAR